MENTTNNPAMHDKGSGFPRISLILPFEPKMSRQQALFDMLTAAADKAEKELDATYPEETVKPVMKKLRRLIEDIHCRRDKKTICVFVSPVTEKVCYFEPTTKLSAPGPHGTS